MSFHLYTFGKLMCPTDKINIQYLDQYHKKAETHSIEILMFLHLSICFDMFLYVVSQYHCFYM